MSLEMNTPPKATGYLLLFRNSDWSSGLSEGDAREGMEKIKAWFDGLFATGKVVAAQPLMEEAVALAKTNPAHDFGMTTEVRTTSSSCPHLYRYFSSLAAEAVA